MHYTTLGKTGLKVSVAGLGCGGNSRIGLGSGLGESQAVALVKEALDLGVNLLDTAASYGTEEVVGKAIKGRPREAIVISTKSHINKNFGPEPMTAADYARIGALLDKAGFAIDTAGFKRIASARSLYHWHADAEQEY